jgi:TetR/AcrR family transcriptional regulator
MISLGDQFNRAEVPMGSKRRGRPAGGSTEATKEAILLAAEALFGEVGFDASSTREIAEKCGLNKALIHYHFKSKDDLLAAVLDRHYDRLGQALVVATEDAKSVEDRLRRVIDAYVDFLATNHHFAKIVQREVASGKHTDKVWERTLPVFKLMTEWVSREFPATQMGPLAAPQLLLSFYGMVVTYFVFEGVVEKLIEADPLGPDPIALRKEHLHRMLDIVLAELNRGPSPAKA